MIPYSSKNIKCLYLIYLYWQVLRITTCKRTFVSSIPQNPYKKRHNHRTRPQIDVVYAFSAPLSIVSKGWKVIPPQ